LRADPYQLRNVIDDANYHSELTELRARLNKHLAQTQDPVALTGKDVFSQYKYYDGG
jgi:hypothetical protein